MSDLRTWIEAQLKRGYSRNQIKDALVRKGYSLKAAAEVDKIANKKAPSLPSIKIALVVIGIVIAIGVIIFLTQEKPEPENMIQDFMKESLSNDYFPSSLDFRKIPPRNASVATWTVNTTRFSMSYSLDGNLDFVSITAAASPLKRNLDENLASLISKKFFKHGQGNWKCVGKDNSSLCESFWLDGENKKGIVVRSPVRGKASTVTLIYTCMIPKGSDIYSKNSCIQMVSE